MVAMDAKCGRRGLKPAASDNLLAARAAARRPLLAYVNPATT
jgi:hypothetical protein